MMPIQEDIPKVIGFAVRMKPVPLGKCAWCGRDGVEVRHVTEMFREFTPNNEKICAECWKSLN